MNKKEIISKYIENCNTLYVIKEVGLNEITKNEEIKNLIIEQLKKIENDFIEYEIEIEVDINSKIEEVHYMINLLETGY